MPLSAEAIVSINVIGQFAQRRDLYTNGIPIPGREIVPVNNQRVYFVFVLGAEVPPGSIDTVVRKVEAKGARLLPNANGVIALIWNPPRGVTNTRLSSVPARVLWVRRSGTTRMGPERIGLRPLPATTS